MAIWSQVLGLAGCPMPDLRIRGEFAAIVSGWTLVSGFNAITEKLEEAAAWAKLNGPLLPAEEKTIHMMIECQIARGDEMHLDWED